MKNLIALTLIAFALPVSAQVKTIIYPKDYGVLIQRERGVTFARKQALEAAGALVKPADFTTVKPAAELKMVNGVLMNKTQADLDAEVVAAEARAKAEDTVQVGNIIQSLDEVDRAVLTLMARYHNAILAGNTNQLTKAQIRADLLKFAKKEREADRAR